MSGGLKLKHVAFIGALTLMACAQSMGPATASASGPATHFTLTSIHQVGAGSDFYLTITAADSSGAKVSAYTGTVKLMSSDPLATELTSTGAVPLPQNLSFGSSNQGQRRITVALGTAGAQTFSASDGAGISGTSASIAVAAAGNGPARSVLLYATNFNPSTFSQQRVGSSASLTGDSSTSLVCTVGSAGSKMIASVKNWSVSEPAAIWAEYDVKLSSITGGLQGGFYYEGLGGSHRHLHLDFAKNVAVLRDKNFKNEGPQVAPTLSNMQSFHFVVVASSPRYRVYINGTLAIDFTDSAAATPPSGFGFDCASSGGTGSITITNLSLYTVTGG
jgi:hypothetical protein